MVEGINTNPDLNPELETKPVERAVVLLKPGYLEFIDRLTGYLTKKGLTVLDQKTISFDEKIAESFYPHAASAIEAKFGPEEVAPRMKKFIDYISSGEAIALLVEGDDAIQKVNRLRGKIRSWFHLEKPDDAIHASSDPEEAEREASALGLSGENETE